MTAVTGASDRSPGRANGLGLTGDGFVEELAEWWA